MILALLIFRARVLRLPGVVTVVSALLYGLTRIVAETLAADTQDPSSGWMTSLVISMPAIIGGPSSSFRDRLARDEQCPICSSGGS
jgi:prolipoprotein diacylglyceryltransferase